MFFKKTTRQRTSPRPTLNAETLEPRAMLSVSPVDPVVALDVGPVNQAGYDCTHAGTCSGIWTNGGASTLRIHGNSGPEGTSHLRSENRFVVETPNNDTGITLHASAHPHADPDGFMKLGDIKGEFQPPQRVGKGTFTTGAGGDSIVHPQFNVGENGRMIIHPQFNVGEDGRMIIHPQFNVGEDGRMIVHPQFNVGEDAVWTNGSATSLHHTSTSLRSDNRFVIEKPNSDGNNGLLVPAGYDLRARQDGSQARLHDSVHCFSNGLRDALPTGTMIPHEDSHLSAKDLIGQPPEPKVAPPAPHVSDRAAVIDGGRDSYTHVERTSSAPRLNVFAMLGR